MNNKRRNKSATALHSDESKLFDDKVLGANELLYKREHELNKTRATLEAIREERDQLRRKVHKLLDDITRLKEEQDCTKSNADTKEDSSSHAVSKKAEKVKLKKTENRKSENRLHNQLLHGSALIPEKLSSNTAEQLAQSVNNSSRFHEILHTTSVIGPYGEDSCALQNRFKLEMEKLQSRIDHLRSENRILELSLQESKTKTEQAQIQLCKHQSNDVALHMSLFYSELIAEAYETILNLIERKTPNGHQKLQEVLSKCNQKEKDQISIFSNCVQQALTSDFADLQFPYSFSLFLEEYEVCGDHLENMTDQSLPALLKKLQRVGIRKNSIKQTILDLSSFTIESLHPPHSIARWESGTPADLENAVLLNELTSVKKELAELKCHEFSSFQTRSRSDLHSCPEYDNHNGSAVQSEDCVWSLSQKFSEERDSEKPLKCSKLLSLADLRIWTMTESEIGVELSQALKREEKLKKEVERITFTLQQVQHNSEQRHQKSADVLKTLKSSYGVLLDNTMKQKRKNAKTIEYLKQQIEEMEAQHRKEIERLKCRIMIFERDKENAILPENETAL